MQKILGLDLGSYSIKAIEILNTFKTYKVTAFHEVVMPEIEGVDPRSIGTTAIRQLFAENEIDVDRTYTAMLGLHVSMRVLQLQNVKKRNIPSVVQNELESQAPFAIEDTVIDQQILETNDGVTTVLAVMCLKDHVEAYLNGLKDCNIEPKVIDVDYLSFMNLIPFLDFEAENASNSGEARKHPDSFGSRLILDIGHAKTSIVLFNEGKILSARTVRLGGRFFTEYLQKSLNVSFNEAQRLKHTVSRIDLGRSAGDVASRSKEDLSVSRQLGIAINELVKELIRTLHSFKAHERVVPSSIILTGGSAVIRNLPEYLEEVLEIPVRTMTFDRERLHIEDSTISGSPAIAQALATGLRGVPGKTNSQINLRKGELALVGSYDAVIKQVSNVSLLVASLLFCLLGSYGLRWWLYGKQIDALKTEFRNEVIRIVGQEPRQLRNIAAGNNWQLSAYSSGAIKFINEEISNRKSVIDEFAARKSAYPLRLLNEISQVIPTDLKVDVTNYFVQGKTFNLEGETDSFSSSEKILGFLQKSPSLTNVERKSQENKPGTDGKVVKFIVSAEIKGAN
jgi:type IV pilus assembly protein PilM